MTLELLVKEVLAEPFYVSGTWRLGQTYYNVFARYYPVEVKLINGTDKDCFYLDNRIPPFWNI